MAFTLKVNGTGHSVVVKPDTIGEQVEGGALFGLTAVNFVTHIRVLSSPARNPKTVEREARNVKWREKMKRYKYAD
jgi:hypothetical protein